ncbi:Bcr/CflA family efflux MFS transporter [Ferrovibrio sp.]|uniref:Bcr/CflA family efflux MFS transporter n=1 Tax=Ferrovibrio sp. TaxID=1917215 RepID=UPI0025B84108|nr:Bcr/CflA family efflux MFS transporter [Ferrovibrio sp.]MBX3455393.1 Bcr/CflA family efflux MFS transporter [Ferrovibrio sp.]
MGLLILLTVLNGNAIMAATVYLPSLPSIGRALDIPAEVMPLTLTIYLMAFGFGQLLFGPLSDRLGRRRVLLAGLVAMVMGSVACAMAGSLTGLLAARLLQGLGAAAGMASGRAVLNDVYVGPAAARASSIVSASLALAPILAPLLGGLIEEGLGWRANFAFSGLITVVVLAALFFRLPETHRPGPPQASLARQMLHSYGLLLHSRAFLSLIIVSSCIYAGLHGFNSGAPAVMIETLGVSPVLYGLLAASASAGFFAGAMIASLFGLRLGVLHVISLGGLFLALGGIGLAVWVEMVGASVESIVISRMIWAIGMGLAMPTSMTAAIGLNRSMLGAGAALAGFTQTMGGALGAAAIAMFPAGNPHVLALVCGGTVVLGVLCWIGNYRAIRRAVTGE